MTGFTRDIPGIPPAPPAPAEPPLPIGIAPSPPTWESETNKDRTAKEDAPRPGAEYFDDDRGPIGHRGRNSIPKSHRGEGNNFID